MTRNRETRDVHGCIYAIEPNVIRYDEPPELTADEARVIGDEITAATRGTSEYSMVVDLTVASLPNAVVRKAIREHFFAGPGLTYVALFTGKNTAINVVVKLVLGQVMRDGMEYSISTTFDEALAKVRAHQSQRRRRA